MVWALWAKGVGHHYDVWVGHYSEVGVGHHYDVWVGHYSEVGVGHPQCCTRGTQEWETGTDWLPGMHCPGDPRTDPPLWLQLVALRIVPHPSLGVCVEGRRVGAWVWGHDNIAGLRLYTAH